MILMLLFDFISISSFSKSCRSTKIMASDFYLVCFQSPEFKSSMVNKATISFKDLNRLFLLCYRYKEYTAINIVSQNSLKSACFYKLYLHHVPYFITLDLLSF
jgi:hypothetical protein